MKITLSSQRSDATLTVSKLGDVLTINGVSYDFGPLLDGQTLPGAAVDCPRITGDVRREGGQLHITLLIPHGPDASESARFPAPLINPLDGPLELPQ